MLIGKDGIDTKNSRADAIIILTIDNENKALKFTSLARDTLVYIPKRGYDKLNHSFYYGGPNLLLETINKNLNLNINDYIIVNFKTFVEIINILGGVEVDIEEREIPGLNKVINTCYELNFENKGNNIEYITNNGKNQLNGYQTLAYCRLRKIDDCFYRDARQRKVLVSLEQKLCKISILKYPELIKTLWKYVDINISLNRILNLAIKSKSLINYDIKQLEFPLKKYREDGQLNNNLQYVILWQKEENLDSLYNFIYN